MNKKIFSAHNSVAKLTFVATTDGITTRLSNWGIDNYQDYPLIPWETILKEVKDFIDLLDWLRDKAIETIGRNETVEFSDIPKNSKEFIERILGNKVA